MRAVHKTDQHNRPPSPEFLATATAAERITTEEEVNVVRAALGGLSGGSIQKRTLGRGVQVAWGMSAEAYNLFCCHTGAPR
jgi:hypothetical protein